MTMTTTTLELLSPTKTLLVPKKIRRSGVPTSESTDELVHVVYKFVNGSPIIFVEGRIQMHPGHNAVNGGRGRLAEWCEQ